MDHEATETGVSNTVASTGLTRRQMLARSAAIGGGVLAAQSLGTVAAFAQTSAPPPTDQPTPTELPSSETNPPSESPTVEPSSSTEPTPTSTSPTGSSTTPTSGSTPTTTSGNPPPGSSGRAATGQTTRVAAQTATSSTELPHTGVETPYLLAAGLGGIAAGGAMVRRTSTATGPDEAEPVFELEGDGEAEDESDD